MSRFWTIGYGRSGLPDFIAALKAAKIQTLVDVREVANSRRAGFSKRVLAASLDEAGVAYVHMKTLGTPKAGREAARRGDTKTMNRIFRAHLEEPECQLALVELGELARKSRICLMCLEHDWRVCHRAIVAEELEHAGLRPVHLAPEAAP